MLMAKVTQLKIELEQEEDGRWIGEVPSLPGVMAYGQTKGAALAAVQALALRAMTDRLEHDEAVPEELLNVSFIAA
jgi:predicted RNase H-like HicB family nuclease